LQYSHKPRGWILGYSYKGKYQPFGANSKYVPKGVDFIDLVVPLKKGMKFPVGCEVNRVGKENRVVVKVPRENIAMFEVGGLDTAEFLQSPPPKPKPVKSEYDEQISVIRRALKKLCPTLSVAKGRGTGYSWIDIRGSGKGGEFTEQEKQALDKFGLGYGANFSVISPENRKYYVERAEEILRS